MFIIQQLFVSPILISAAVIPAILLLIYVYKKDKLEKEPKKLLVRLVLWGILSTLLATMTEELGIALLPRYFDEGSRAYYLALYFIVVALSEEGFKFFVLKWKSWNDPAFNCQFDGVVYAVFVSLGFALWENIGYVLAYGLGTALARAVTAVPGHACFGVFMGAFYGAAKRVELAGDPGMSKILRFLSLLVAVLLHGAYDYLASQIETASDWFFVLFIIVIFIISYRMVKKLSENDRYIRPNVQ